MADHHTVAPRPAAYPTGRQNGRRDGIATPESKRGNSYDMANGGNVTRQRDTTLTLTDPHLPVDNDDNANDESLNDSPSAAAVPDHDEHGQRNERIHNKKRGRFSGSFLLQDTFGSGRLLGSRRQRGQPAVTPQKSPSSSGREAASRNSTGSDRGTRQISMPTRRSLAESPTSLNDASPTETRRFSDSHMNEPEESPGMDLDSTQIVHMALNLSESRRLAARRNVSRTMAPPRLTPLPDVTSSSNLRQHLQQQRKTSRGTPAKPTPEASPMVTSITRMNGPFQPSFDATHDAQYRWQFSASTLTRVQKAKEHLELLAQYRRLLEVLPPLKPGIERPGSSNTPGSPPGVQRQVPLNGQAQGVTLGRQYNPLQYIRNRKVRARERKIIDGDRQGFGDAESVKSWVDMVYRQMSLVGTSLVQDKASIPVYPGAEELLNQPPPDNTAKARTRRPRVDWFIEPCDMIADAYWLEQDGHKQLIEDRQWRKIFRPPVSDLRRPQSREVDDPATKISPFSPKAIEQSENMEENKDSMLAKVRTDLSHGSATERAKQKLQSITGFHHRHGSSIHGQPDILRLKRGSISEYSESDNEVSQEFRRRKPMRKATITSNTNDLLQKQMLEMVAREARERELEDAAVVNNYSADDQGLRTPERLLSAAKTPSRLSSRRASLADVSDTDRKVPLGRAKFSPPPRRSLDVNFSMGSFGSFSSAPGSPELVPTRNGNLESIASADLSSPPWSRSASPVRNPITKIKQIIRDKTGDNGDSQNEDGEEDRRTSTRGSIVAPSDSSTTLDRQTISQSGRTLSPTGSFRQHRTTGSNRLRPDEIIGLRSMFKGPRIDTVIRGGVSKLGDIIRKKDGSAESPDQDTTDDSDSDRIRGRQRDPPVSLSRRTFNRTQDGHQPKHFLDTMPQFLHAHDHRRSNGETSRAPGDASASHSRQSSRVGHLKQPRFDVRSASSSMSPPVIRQPRLGDSDLSEPESFPGSVPEAVRDADKRLNSAITLGNYDSKGQLVGRHWSIAERGLPERTTLSKREVARMRALILSSGIKAMEIRRRAYEKQQPFSKENLARNESLSKKEPAGIAWSDIAALSSTQSRHQDEQVPFNEVYQLAATTLRGAIQAWGKRWQSSTDFFTNRTTPELRNRIWEVRTRLADDLSQLTHKAADEADETGRDLALGQPLKVKHVLDLMETMLRRRRRRFRWLRRGMWLTVEWLLVGFMWYVWFVVMILRIFFGVGKGIWTGVRWLLFL